MFSGNRGRVRKGPVIKFSYFKRLGTTCILQWAVYHEFDSSTTRDCVDTELFWWCFSDIKHVKIFVEPSLYFMRLKMWSSGHAQFTLPSTSSFFPRIQRNEGYNAASWWHVVSVSNCAEKRSYNPEFWKRAAVGSRVCSLHFEVFLRLGTNKRQRARR